MNRIPHFITQSIDWCDGLDQFIFFFLVFFLKKTAFDLLAFITVWLSLDTSGETTWIILEFCLIVGLLRLVCLLMLGQYVYLATFHHMTNDLQQNVSIAYIFWWQMLFNNSFYIASHEAAISFLIWTSSLFFFFRLFYLSTRFISVLTLKSSAIHWLTCFQVSSGKFLVLFWMIWMLVTMHKLCEVPHASWITACGTIFTERHSSVSKEWVRSSSQAFLIFYHKMLIKRFLAVHPGKVMIRKKREKQTFCVSRKCQKS